MARKRGGWASFVVKWLVIPAVLATVGFFVIGPRLGDVEEKKKRVSLEPVNEDGTPIRRSGNPKVEVSAQRVSERRSSRRRTEEQPASTSSEPKASGGEPKSEAPAPVEEPPSDPSPEPTPPADSGDGSPANGDGV